MQAIPRLYLDRMKPGERPRAWRYASTASSLRLPLASVAPRRFQSRESWKKTLILSPNWNCQYYQYKLKLAILPVQTETADTTSTNRNCQYYQYKQKLPILPVQTETANTTSTNRNCQYYQYKLKLPILPVQTKTANTTSTNRNCQYYQYKQKLPILPVQTETADTTSTNWNCRYYQYKLKLAILPVQTETANTTSTNWNCWYYQYKQKLCGSRTRPHVTCGYLRRVITYLRFELQRRLEAIDGAIVFPGEVKENTKSALYIRVDVWTALNRSQHIALHFIMQISTTRHGMHLYQRTYWDRVESAWPLTVMTRQGRKRLTSQSTDWDRKRPTSHYSLWQGVERLSSHYLLWQGGERLTSHYSLCQEG